MHRVDPGIVFRQLTDEGEQLVDLFLAEMADIQVHHVAERAVDRVAFFVLLDERLGQPVARTELHAALLGVFGVVNIQRLAEVVVAEVPLAVLVEEDAAFRPCRLGDENARARQPGRMVLHKLHVLQRYAGSIRQRHAVARLDRAVGGEREDSSRPAGAEDHGLGGNTTNLAGAEFDCRDTLAPPVFNEQLRGEPLVVPHHLVVFQQGLKQRVQHMEAGLVRGEPCALDVHPAERSHRDMAVRLAVPRAAPMLQLDQLLWGLSYEQFDRILVRQPIRSADRVVTMSVERVVVLDDRRRPSFGGDRVASHRINLRHHRHREGRIKLSDRDGSAQPGPAAANDHDVMLQSL